MALFAATKNRAAFLTQYAPKVHLTLSPTPLDVEEKHLAQGPSEPCSLKYIAMQSSDVGALTASRPTHDFVAWMPPILDQSAVGSCTSNVIANMIRFKLFYDACIVRNSMPTDAEKKIMYGRMMLPARLFIYYNSRLEDNPATVSYDIGATMSGAFLSIYNHGFFDEVYSPYLLDNYPVEPTNLATYLGQRMAKQSAFNYTKVLFDKALRDELDNMFPDDGKWPDLSVIPGYTQDAYVAPLMRLLAANQPVAFGIAVESASFFNMDMVYDGYISLPTTWPNGGHAMIMVGYDLPRRKFIVSSSWGTSVGLHRYPGYFEIGFDYICMLAYDFYVWTNI